MKAVNKKKYRLWEKYISFLNDIKIEVCCLSVLLELNKHIMELNVSFPNIIEGKLTGYTANVNRSVSEIYHKLLILMDY